MTKKKSFITFFFSFCFIFYFLNFSCSQPTEQKSFYPLCYNEIWGYVMTGKESDFSQDMPVTDVGYFASSIGIYSTVLDNAPRDKYFANYTGRVHLVSSVDSKSQTHLLLDKTLPLRDRIIADLVKRSETYEGLQIDWELVPQDDADNFYDFLVELKKQLKGKMLTLAIPARTKTLAKDPYSYSRLSKVADKILVMAYDQHWSTSKPGPVASPDWCKRIYDYAKTQIPQDKLIMGAPFYGRAWTDDKIGARAWYNTSVQRLIKENDVQSEDIQTDSNGNKYFKLKKENTITVYFDDKDTCIERMMMYSKENLKKIGFWRIGQEDPEIWKYITLVEE